MRDKVIKFLFFASLITLVIIYCAIIFVPKKEESIYRTSAVINTQVPQRETKIPEIIMQDTFYQETNFQQAVLKAENVISIDNIHSIIIPHHLLASEFVAKLIKQASARQINKVVIVGPNHNNIGMEAIATVKARWLTPFGNLEPQIDLVDKFLTDFSLIPNYQALVYEHSIGAITPFIKYYLPQAKIIPIIISSYAARENAQELSEWLINNLDNQSLIIFSMDFSHYLSLVEAEEKDKLTKQYILNRDIDKILTLNNDYVDSPVGLAASLLIADKLDLETKIIYQANSADFTIEKPIETTSYLGIIFY